MFLATPVQHKSRRQALPWVTALLILVNCAVYFGWQVSEEKAVELPRLQHYAPDVALARLLAKGASS